MTIRIHGSFYHRIGSLLPDKNKITSFQQVLFHDTDNELDNRLLNFSGLDRNILFDIQNVCIYTILMLNSLKSFPAN